ncbi:DUF2927 domain-containing protein [Jannaschia sp. LMIT008]|uniref:DUF2927 domain-containing protein n=1 Tax=Jannaschia maritima TaxID=3032585 RepID=UPI0028114C6C|nr:DUF2927 domain-containing protein [Jannaschia sp. LMIT008]
MIRAAALALAALGVAACQPVVAPPPPSDPPPPRPVVARPAPPPLAAPSAESVRLAAFYRTTEARLLRQGLLRRDREPADAPFGPDRLARDFERVALFSEYTLVGGRYVAQQSRASLRRWQGPVRVQLHFGASVDPVMRRADTARLGAYLDRLRRATGHPIALVEGGGNYHVFVASIDEQRALGPKIARVEPGLGRDIVREITSFGPSTYCAVYASSTAGRPDAYVSAIALIRAEHPDLMRLACYHEELAQGLGLANDSPAARPSIFNDDDEFALLTRHDELLLRMLYDPRLRPGMTAEEARPLIRRIAAELVGQGPV